MRVLRILSLAALIGFVALVGALLFAVRSLPPDLRRAVGRTLDPKAGAAIALTEYLELQVNAGGRFKLALGGVGGDVIRGITIRDVRLAQAADPNAPPILTADSIMIRYDLRQIARTRRLHAIDIARPRVDVRGLPPREGGARRRGLVLPALPVRGVDSVLVSAGALDGVERLPIDDLRAIARVDLVGRRASVALERATFAVDTIRAGAAARVVVAPDSIHVEGAEATLGDTRISVAGIIALADSARVELDVTIDSLLLGDLAPIVPGLPGDARGSGRITLLGAPGRLAMRGSLTGEYSDYAVLVPVVWLSLSPQGVSIDSIEAAARGAVVKGSLLLPHGPLKEHAGRLRFSDVDLAALAPPSSKAPQTQLSGAISWEGAGVAANTLEAILDLRLSEGRVGTVPFESVAVDGLFGARALQARSLEVDLLGGRFEGAGSVSLDGELDLAADADFPDLSRTGALVQLPSATGSAQFTGRIVRSRAELLFDGTLTGQSWGGKGYRAEQVEATGTFTERGGERTVVASGAVTGVDAMGLRLGDARAAIRYEREHLLIEQVAGKLGPVEFEARGEVIDEGAEQRIVISSLTVTKDSVRHVHPEAIELVREGDRLSLLPVSIPLRDGQLVASGEYDPRGAREARVLWSGLRASDLPLPAPLHSSLLDQTSGSLVLEDLSGSPELHVRMRGASDSPDTTRFTTVDLAADLSANGPLFAELTLAGAEGRGPVKIAGTLTDSLSVRLAGARGSVRERVALIARPDLVMTAEEVPIAWIRGIASELRSTGGVVSAEWQMSGDPTNLSVSGPLSMTPLVFQGDTLGNIAGDVALGGGRLRAEVAFDPTWGKSTCEIDLPARLDATAPSLEMASGEPLAIRARIEEGDLGLLPLIWRDTRNARGAFNMVLEMAGTLASPEMTGSATIIDGTTQFRDLSEVYEQIGGRVFMDEEKITLEGVEGRVWGDGTIRVDGTIGLSKMRPSQFDLTITLRNFYVSSIPGAAALIDADLVVKTATTAFGAPVPHITGRIEVLGGIIDQEFSKPGQETPFAALLNIRDVVSEGLVASSGPRPPPAIFQPSTRPPWTCEIEVRAPGDLWIRNSAMEIELQGDGILYRSVRGLGFVGSLDVRRGKYSLIGAWIPTQLRVDEGTVLWSDADNASNFNVSARASTRIDEDEVDISMRAEFVGGVISDSLELHASSEGGLSQDEILQQIVTNSASGGGGLVGAWVNTLTELLSREIAGGIFSFASLEVGYEAGETALRVERDLGSDLVVSYEERFGTATDPATASNPRGGQSRLRPDRQIGLDYRLSRILFIEAHTGSLPDASPFANLDLKARVGY